MNQSGLPHTGLFGLLGHPLGHSFSKSHFTEKFRREGLDCRYENFDLVSLEPRSDGNDGPGSLRTFLTNHPDLKGFNVTSPYKEAILPYLDSLDPVAAELGAVNTVKRLPDGSLRGYNTDVVGIEATLRPILERTDKTSGHGNQENPRNQKDPENQENLGNQEDLGNQKDPENQKNLGDQEDPGNPWGLGALILGTGGASKAVQYVLGQHHIPYHLVSRDPDKGHFTYKTLSASHLQRHLFIINATPVGMAPHDDCAPAIPYEAITPRHLLFDLIYNPEETLFLRHGKARGAQTLNGLTLLYAQAKASWTIWTTNP